MHRIILFRGGMCGDLILGMIDKKYVKSVYPFQHIKGRQRMKKFFEYSDKEKQEYFENMEGYTLSHDTEFCRNVNPDSVVQLFCSDKKMMPVLAERFWTKNDSKDVEHVKSDLTLDKDYTLSDDMQAWQDFHVFKHRFDIKNVYKITFVNDVEKCFGIKDLGWAKTLHKIWLDRELR